VARKKLDTLLGWFTEGFDTRDLKEAKALLDAFQTHFAAMPRSASGWPPLLATRQTRRFGAKWRSDGYRAPNTMSTSN
jgi:hypothetical protein